MSLIRRIRHLRWLPRAALAAFVLVTLQTMLPPCAMAMVDSMSAHCVFCPPVSDENANSGCVLARAPGDLTTENFNQIVQFFPTAMALPFVTEFRATFPTTIPARATHGPPPSRPLILTHCVQLK